MVFFLPGFSISAALRKSTAHELNQSPIQTYTLLACIHTGAKLFLKEYFDESMISFLKRSGAMCVYSTLSHDKFEYTHMAPLCSVHV